MWDELKLETYTPEWKDLLGVKLSELPLVTLDHLGKRIKKIGTSYPRSIPPKCYINWFGIICLSVLCSISVLLMAFQKTMHMYPSTA